MITVFTPAYNRAHTIDKLYRSLLSQTCFDFEWVVVDDGSTDGTETYFEKILKCENPFKITYVKQPNGGKHRAINRGVQLAGGELFFIVDSDDYLTPDAIGKLIEWRSSLEGSKQWAGVSGVRGYSESECIGGDGGGSSFIDATNLERGAKNLCGDKAEAYFTEVLKKYPFPEFDGENFITEEVVWNAIAYDGYYLRWYRNIIYICEYLEGGLTKSGDKKYENNPQGVLYWTKLQLKVFPDSLRRKFSAVNRYYQAVKKNKKVKEIAKDIGISKFYVRIAVFAVRIKRLFKR